MTFTPDQFGWGVLLMATVGGFLVGFMVGGFVMAREAKKSPAQIHDDNYPNN